MLQKIHDQAQSWIAWVIVGLLSIPFALWGINSYFDGGGSGVVAEVDEIEISLNDYQRSLQQQRQRIRALLGANYSPEMLENPQMRRAVLDAMIENELLTQTLRQQGYRIDDAMLLTQLGRVEAFQRNGSFDPALYEQLLAQQGMSTTFFEASLSNDLVQSQQRNAFRSAAFVTATEMSEMVRLRDQQRSVRLLTLPATVDQLSDQTVTEEVIERRYNDSGHRYETPEQLTIRYIEIAVADLGADASVTEQEIESLYQQRKSGLMAEEERHARHILVEINTDRNEQSALERIQQVEHRLQQGEPFEALAKEFSDDPGSAQAGGDLGFFSRGIMVPEFDDAVLSLAIGSTSAPVRTDFGYHLIHLEEVQAATLRSYDEVRPELLSELQRRQGEERFYEQVETVSNLAYEQPDSLDGAATAIGIEVQESPLFDRQGGEGISANPAIVRAAFSDLVLREGKNSDPIELSDDRVVVLRLGQHQPASRIPLTEVRSQVVDEILLQRAREQAHSAGSALLTRLQQGELTPEQAATESGQRWTEQTLIQRHDATLPSAAVKRAFQLRQSNPDQPAYGGSETATGHTLIELSGVVDGDLSTLEEGARKRVRGEMIEQQWQGHQRSYIDSLLRSASITVNEELLN